MTSGLSSSLYRFFFLFLAALFGGEFIIEEVDGSEEIGQLYSPEFSDGFQDAWRWSKIDALSEYRLLCVSESSDGTLWFGAEGGVLCYDGYEVVEVLSCDFVVDIAAFSSEDVYVLTETSLWMFDGETWTLLREIKSEKWINDRIAQSEDGVVWVAAESGLLRISEGEIEREKSVPYSVSGIQVDDLNRLWMVIMGTGRVVVCPIENGRLGKYRDRVEVLHKVSDGVSAKYHLLNKGIDGRMWVIAVGRDCVARYYDRELKEHLVDGPRELDLKEPILVMAESVDGTLWMIDRNELYSIKDNQWRRHPWSQEHFGQAVHRVSVLYSNSEGKLIIGGSGSPLFVVDLSQERWSSVLGMLFQCDDLRGNRWYIDSKGEVVEEQVELGKWVQHPVEKGVVDLPLAILSASDGTIWVAGAHAGEAAVSYLKNGEWNRIQHPELGDFISHLSLYEDKRGRILLGGGHEFGDTVDSGLGGAVLYEAIEDDYSYTLLGYPRYPKRIVSIVNSAVGEYWFGGANLVHQIKGDREIVKLYDDEPYKWVDHVLLDSQGRIWTAVFGKGVCRISEEGIVRFTDRDGLNSKMVCHLLLDSDDHVWAATPNGVSRYDGESWTEFALPKSIHMEREGGVLKQARDGSIWVGLAERNWFFRGSALRHEPSGGVYKMRSIRCSKDDRPPLAFLRDVPESILESGNIHLSWSGIDYWSKTPVEALEYSYRLNDDEWGAFSKKTNHTFLKLKTGDYNLQVRTRDRDGNVSLVPAEANFVVVPLLWKRPWFIAVEVSVFLLIVYLIWVIVRMRVRHMVETRDFKLWFFTQISHELKTPLSLILSPVESALKHASDERSKGALQIARRNAKKMLHLVNQLLEFQKVELGGLRVELTRVDLIGFIENSFSNYELLAAEKNLDLNFASCCDQWVAYLDRDKLQKILDNLVSNAVKYTPESGAITLSVNMDDRTEAKSVPMAVIRVEDTGVGIPKKELALIFDRYYRVGNPTGDVIQGTGIGLALTKELVRACQGTIDVESPILLSDGSFGGSRFTVRLPMPDSEPTELPSGKSVLEPAGESKSVVSSDSESLREPIKSVSKSKQAVVLIVDDNRDIRSFLRMELEGDFSLIEAEDGKSGLALAQKSAPDLVITDVMMPEVDGHAFCRSLKADRLTSHIPVIMLTAKASVQSQLQGLELGADDYLFKPIETELLRVRIHNLLASREALRIRFVEQTVLVPKEVTVSSIDEQLLEKAISVVEKNMSDADFSVELFTEAMHMSRMTLYRKLKALTGQTPTAFISALRLKRAKQLLKKESITVVEVSNLIGFNDSNYFSNRFKKEFGETPTEYMTRVRKQAPA